MKLAEITNKLKENGVDVKSININTKYVLRLSNKSTIHINYLNDDFRRITVDGKYECVEQTKKILGIKE